MIPRGARHKVWGSDLALVRTLPCGHGALIQVTILHSIRPKVLCWAQRVQTAAEPWSPANHELFPAADRTRALEIKRMARLAGEGGKRAAGERGEGAAGDGCKRQRGLAGGETIL